MKIKEMEESKKIKSNNRIWSWGKAIAFVLVVGCCIFSDFLSSDYTSYSSANSYNVARESAIECKRFFPDKYATIALHNLYPSCYRKPNI